MEQRLSLVTLGVSDLRRARTFYEPMGWRPAPGTDDVVFFQAGQAELGVPGRDPDRVRRAGRWRRIEDLHLEVVVGEQTVRRCPEEGQVVAR